MWAPYSTLPLPLGCTLIKVSSLQLCPESLFEWPSLWNDWKVFFNLQTVEWYIFSINYICKSFYWSSFFCNNYFSNSCSSHQLKCKYFIKISLIYTFMMISNTQHNGSAFTSIIKSSPIPLQSLSFHIVRCYRVINSILRAMLLSLWPMYIVFANYCAP